MYRKTKEEVIEGPIEMTIEDPPPPRYDDRRDRYDYRRDRRDRYDDRRAPPSRRDDRGVGADVGGRAMVCKPERR